MSINRFRVYLVLCLAFGSSLIDEVIFGNGTLIQYLYMLGGELVMCTLVVWMCTKKSVRCFFARLCSYGRGSYGMGERVFVWVDWHLNLKYLVK